MRSGFRVLTCAVLASGALSGCATVEERQSTRIQQEPSVSKTVEQQDQRTLKRTVAVGRFSNETNYGKSAFHSGKASRVEKQARDILLTKLADTGKFILVERPDVEAVKGQVSAEGMDDFGLEADYLIVGSVSEFGRSTESEVGVFSRVKRQKAHAKVYLRLLDAKTGEVIYSEEGSGEAFTEAGTVMGAGENAGYDSTLNDKAISGAIGKLVSNIVENLLDKPWRSYILQMTGDEVVVAGGKSQGVRSGDKFIIYKKGERVENPQTGKIIELPGEQVARIRVSQVVETSGGDGISRARVVSGSLDEHSSSELYVESEEGL